MFQMPSIRRERPVAHLLTGLVLACLLPGVLGSALFLLNEYRDERRQQNEQMLALARDIGRTIDTHLLHAQTLARSLSPVPQATSADADLFSPQGARSIASVFGSPVVVYHVTDSGTTGISSRGEQAPPNPLGMQAVGAVFATGKAVIGDVVLDAATGERVVVAHLPIVRAGKTGYVLGVSIPTAELSALLAQRHLPQGWLAALLDHRGIIAGRNRAADRYAGQPAMDSLRSAIAAQEEGELDTVTKEGVPNFTVFVRSPLTGYTIIVGIPHADVVGPLTTRLLYLAAALACLSTLGLLLARAMSRRIAGSMQALIAPATALGQGMPPAMPAVHLREAAQVGAAIERAAALLCQRDAALRAQQEELQQFKFFSEHANEMLLLLDEDGRIRYANRRASTRCSRNRARHRCGPSNACTPARTVARSRSRSRPPSLKSRANG
jgi:PAS domain-containing protein